MTSTPTALTVEQASARLGELTVIDVRTPGEYAAGHLPGAYNVPLDRIDEAVPALRSAASRAGLLMVCASGNRSARACAELAERDVPAATLTGGTEDWLRHGLEVRRPADARTVWAMERQVRLAAGGLVLSGLLAGRRWPAARLLSAGVAGGLVFSAVTDTCGMARLLAKLPHNRAPRAELSATLAELGG
ncbi:rhodanese-like domain-containing protein [Streptomyces sp. NPDC053560]|uniref:rhodanese-like domain-containing protein n=1 Tax=Streptomyces sp. NPDC053560 TaxID=3365711 RepID=UPI0037D3EF6F